MDQGPRGYMVKPAPFKWDMPKMSLDIVRSAQKYNPTLTPNKLKVGVVNINV